MEVSFHMKYSVQGFGAGPQPWNRGVEICQTREEDFAQQISSAMARRYEGQWFGWQNLESRVFSKLVRYGLKEE